MGKGVTATTSVDRKEVFRELVEGQLPRLYSIARRLVGDDAEEAVQEALLKAFRKFDQLQDDSAASAWLTSIIVNVARDRGRAKARKPDEVNIDQVEEFSLYRKVAEEDPFPYSDSLHLDFLQQFGGEDVRAVLMKMPEIYRAPLILVHMQGFSTKEVARIVDAPLGTVLARLHRGRKLFEKKIWDHAVANGLLKEGVR
jgi:RNA polymerase sigma-70 factor (ECF subfamily)